MEPLGRGAILSVLKNMVVVEYRARQLLDINMGLVLSMAYRRKSCSNKLVDAIS